jgi:hypothetical protein
LIAAAAVYSTYKGFPAVAIDAVQKMTSEVGLHTYNRPVVSDTALWPE